MGKTEVNKKHNKIINEKNHFRNNQMKKII